MIHDLADFMHTLTRQMGDEYQRILKRTTEDPGTAGDQGEENWAEILRLWLPPIYQVVTKGRIISERGIASPQVDVLVLKPTYPKALLSTKLYLAAGVEAAFECKNTLRTAHIAKAVENARNISELFEPRSGDPYEELHSPIIYGLLAHSHSWKDQKSTPLQNIEGALVAADQAAVDHPRHMLNLLCVSDLALWSSSVLPGNVELDNMTMTARIIEGLNTGYGVTHTAMWDPESKPGRSFTPIGALITRLTKKISYRNPSVKDISDYFSKAGLEPGYRLNWRSWNYDLISNESRVILNPRQYPGYSTWMRRFAYE